MKITQLLVHYKIYCQKYIVFYKYMINFSIKFNVSRWLNYFRKTIMGVVYKGTIIFLSQYFCGKLLLYAHVEAKIFFFSAAVASTPSILCTSHCYRFMQLLGRQCWLTHSETFYQYKALNLKGVQKFRTRTIFGCLKTRYDLIIDSNDAQQGPVACICKKIK